MHKNLEERVTKLFKTHLLLNRHLYVCNLWSREPDKISENGLHIPNQQVMKSVFNYQEVANSRICKFPFFAKSWEWTKGWRNFTRPFRVLLAKVSSTILAHILYLQIFNFLQNLETEAGDTPDFTIPFRTLLAAYFSTMWPIFYICNILKFCSKIVHETQQDVMKSLAEFFQLWILVNYILQWLQVGQRGWQGLG